MTIKAIETRYKGYRFRSRLEARWAVFFDALGIEWQYEPEGFELADGTRYLPDFWLKYQWNEDIQESGFWVEIKAIAPTESEIRKAKLLACGSGHSLLLLSGTPGEHSTIYCSRDGRGGKPNPSDFDPDPLIRKIARWIPFTRWDVGTPEIESAFVAARSARFEHGECGV